MPIYSYECSKCEVEADVTKGLSEMETVEKCPECKKPMMRVISAVRINTSTCRFEPHYNYAFGKKVNSKRELEECRRRLQGETGKNIVEVGTDDLSSIKRQRKKYEW